MSMRSVVVYDCEFLTAIGAPQRFWCGPNDPDPLTIQIGAVRLLLEPPFDIVEPFERLVVPMDRDGNIVPLDPLVTRLTGLTDDRIASEGMPLMDAMQDFDAYANGTPFYAWGKDELLSLAASLFVQNQISPIAPARFRTAVPLLVQAGEPEDVVIELRSHTICEHFGLPEAGPAHDAVGDARSVAVVLSHLLQQGRLTAHDVYPG